MKKNLPVTQREIGYPESAVFVTKTDTKGVITYANDAFVEISGFSREGLIGSNHNIVRHPDMPEWAFSDLWNTVQAGYPWRGYVKNRAKNGDHYWVRANVSPILNNGNVVGYLSLRKKPSRAEVAAAEALYSAGKPPATRFSIATWFGKLSLQKKLQVLLQPVVLLVVGVATFYIADHVKTRMIDTVDARADAVANEVIDSANMLMVTGQISQPETRQLLIKKLSSSGNIVSLQLVRADSVVSQFGAGLPEEKVRDDIQRQVIASKKPYYEIVHRGEQTLYRVVTPYMFTHNFHGTDCLGCHVAEEGAVSGASDVEIDMSKDFKDHEKFITIINVGQVVFQVVLFFFIGWVVQYFVTRRVAEIRSHLADLVNGDMTGRVDISGRDEMGEILCAVQSSKVLLGSVVDQIVSVSGNIDARAKHLSSTMSRVEKSSQSQSESASSMAAAVEELTVSIDQVASNAGDVRQISDNSKTLASEGGKVVQQVVGDMERINAAVMNAATTVEDLGKKSGQIQNIVKSIQEIADQTNLLALNAAIEAARAGEQGRGFAVVADEVRKLAEKTSKSTQEISAMTQTITGSTGEAVAEMEAAVEMVKSGALLARQAGTSIVEINGGALRVLHGVEDISRSIQEQSQAGREIAENVERVAQKSEENSAAVREVSSTVERLEHLSQSLEESVKHFRV
ncbi:MAG: PAS domain S-box protein [Gallionellaceae bacterium]|nr:MAG: PAS domain S-box protein [Gallionellaceae bacterium]